MRILASLALAVLLGLTVSATTAREWTSRSGGFKVEAELVDVVDGKAILKKEDGKEISVPLDKLSLRDVRYIEGVLKSEQKSITGEGEKEKSSEKEKGTTATTPRDVPQAVEGAGASTKAGPPLAEEGVTAWQVRPDPPQETFTLAPNAEIGIPLPAEASSLEVVFPTQPSPFVVFGITSGRGAAEVWDLRTGQRAGRIAEKIEWRRNNVTLSPDGTLLAAVVSYPEKYLQIWSVKTGSREQKIVLDDGLLEYLRFAGPNRLVGAVVGEGVRVWDLQAGKVSVKYECRLGIAQRALAVSPGGNYLAIAPSIDPPRIIDVRNGVEAGRFQIKSKDGVMPSFEAMAFSPDGKELAGLCREGLGSTVIVWDMATGKIAVERRLSKSLTSVVNHWASYSGGPIEWFADGSGWLFYGAAVVDREKDGPAWVDPSRNDDNSRVPRRIMDVSRMISPEGKRDAMTLRLVPIPKPGSAAVAKADEAEGQAGEAGSKAAEGKAAEGKEGEAGAPPLTKTDHTAAKKVDLAPPGEWAYQPDASPAGELIQAPFSLDLGPITVNHVHFSAAGAAKALVGNTPDDSKYKTGPSFRPRCCDRYDLRTGKRLDRFEVPFPTQLIDYSPEGNLALFKTEPIGDRLDIYALDGGKHVAGFRPYVGKKPSKFESSIRSAALIDANHVLTSGMVGRIVCWSLPDCKPVYAFESIGSWQAFSPNRRAYLMSTRGPAFLVESLTGRVLGVLAEPVRKGALVISGTAFRSDGRKLAATGYAGSGTFLTVWDLTSGKIESDFWLPASPFGISWVGPKHLLVRDVDPPSEEPKTGDRTSATAPRKEPQLLLVDVEKKMVVWRYRLSGYSPQCEQGVDERFWYTRLVGTMGPIKLVPLALPDKAALPVIDAAVPPKPILTSGGKVQLAIQLDLAGEREGSDKVRQLLDKHFRGVLAQNQMEVNRLAPAAMKVVLKEWISEEPKPAVKSRRDLVRRSPGDTLAIRSLEVRCAVTITGADGKTVWSQAKDIKLGERVLGPLPGEGKGLPFTFLSDPWRGALVWCTNLHVPKEVYPSSAYQGLGESQLTSDGAVTVEK